MILIVSHVVLVWPVRIAEVHVNAEVEWGVGNIVDGGMMGFPMVRHCFGKVPGLVLVLPVEVDVVNGGGVVGLVKGSLSLVLYPEIVHHIPSGSTIH